MIRCGAYKLAASIWAICDTRPDHAAVLTGIPGQHPYLPQNKDMKEVMETYLQCLERSDYDTLMELFMDDAMVESPLYGARSAADFYRELFADTSQSDITPLYFFTEPHQQTGAVNFRYQWTLANGQRVSFDCVDVFSFTDGGKIRHMKIIYDTNLSRAQWERQRQPRSRH